MTTQRKVRIGFVGVGMMGQTAHLRNYVALPDCEVVALAELRPELGKRVAAHYGVPRVYPDAVSMFNKEVLDGVVAVQPFERHEQLIAPLYRAGLPILTEKPLASSVEVGERLLSALQMGGSWHMLAYHKRSDPATIYVRHEMSRLQQSGELGCLRYVRILIPEGDWVAGGFRDLITSEEALPELPHDPLPGGVDHEAHRRYITFVNYYSHQINLLRYILGEPYRVRYADPSGVILTVESESGVPGTIEMSPYRTTVDWQESVLIAFERGYIKLELPAPLAINRPGRVEVFRDSGDSAPETRIPQLPWVHAMRQQAVHFVRAIRGEMSPPCEAAEALDDLKIARDYLQLLGSS